MSERVELPEAEALAAEFALGVLPAREHAKAQARMDLDPAFAASAEAWQARLAPLYDRLAPVEPPDGLWRRIERSLPANDDPVDDSPVRRLRFWRAAAAGSLALAAASLAAVVVLVAQEQGSPGAPFDGLGAPKGRLLNASLVQQGGRVQPMFVAAYAPARKALIVTSLTTVDPDHVHQLWLIPADGRPRSVGFLEPGKSRAIPLAPAVEKLVAEGAMLAVSIEAPGGSPNPDAPTGPVAAMGRLETL